MREERFFTAEETMTNERIDKFLSAQMPDRSRSYIQKLIKDGLVEVNGKQVKANYKLGSEDEVKLQIPELEVPDILPEEIPLDILYEDTDLLVVNKPKGMVVHPASGHYTGTYGVSSRFKLRPSVCCPAFYEYRRKHPYNLRCTAFRNTSGSFYSIFSYYLGNDKGIFPYYKGYFHR